MSGLSQRTVTAINEAQYRTLIRRAIDDLMGPADLIQLKRLLFDVEQIELIEPPVPEPPREKTGPRFKIIRRRRGVVYDVAYRKSLKGAEKLALSYFDGNHLQPHEVFIDTTTDPPGRRLFGCGSPLPRWKRLVHLKLWVASMHKPGTKVCNLEVAASDEKSARARAEASMGIGWSAAKVTRVK